MQRREFLSALLGEAVGGLPGAGADPPKQKWERQIHEQLEDAQDLGRELTEAARHRSEMLNLVHAMRAPLACTSLLVDIMRDPGRYDLSNELHRHLEMSARNCERLAELINEVFSLEKSRRKLASASAVVPKDAQQAQPTD
jgi:signal transduction histidine kinase